jgi:hypothetical protein
MAADRSTTRTISFKFAWAFSSLTGRLLTLAAPRPSLQAPCAGSDGPVRVGFSKRDHAGPRGHTRPTLSPLSWRAASSPGSRPGRPWVGRVAPGRRAPPRTSRLGPIRLGATRRLKPHPAWPWTGGPVALARPLDGGPNALVRAVLPWTGGPLPFTHLLGPKHESLLCQAQGAAAVRPRGCRIVASCSLPITSLQTPPSPPGLGVPLGRLVRAADTASGCGWILPS